MSDRDLVLLYAQEAGEGFDRIVRELLALDGGADADAPGRVRAVLRLLHGLKGGAMVVGPLAEVGELLHAAEALLAPEPSPAPALVEQLVGMIDAARALVAAAVAGPAPAEAPAEAPGGELDTVRVAAADLEALSRTLGELSGAEGATQERLADLDEALRALDELGEAGVDTEVRAEARAGLRERLERLGADLGRDAHRFARVARAAQEGAARLRMLPFSAVFDHLRRAQRDLERRTGKRAALALEGGDVLVDKRALDELRPALLHLLRNAMDHGLEPADERRAAGKPDEGRLCVAAVRRAGRIFITVEDDGRGVQEKALRARLRGQGRAEPAGLLDLLVQAGVSTADEVSAVSGRGVGVGSVQEAAERLGGRLELETRPGRGCAFKLALPPTLADRRGLLVTVGGQRMFLPAQPVARIVRVEESALVAAGGRLSVRHGDGQARLVELADALGLARTAPQEQQRRVVKLVVVQVAREAVALVVDEVHGQETVALQPVRPPIRRLRALEGLVARADGEVVPLVDLAHVARHAGGSAPTAPARTAPVVRKAPRVLVVDDSVTTRTLQKGVLEGAGMHVTLACDGREALALVEGGQVFDLVVSDIEMPRLDGVELVRRLRAQRSTAELPVLLVTSVTEDALRARGMDAGADALVLKQTFDPDRVLSMVRALLERGRRVG